MEAEEDATLLVAVTSGLKVVVTFPDEGVVEVPMLCNRNMFMSIYVNQ